jgi:uncharacterized membrane protein YccC
LRAALPSAPPAPGKRVLARIALGLLGILLAWIVLFSIGEAILTYTGRLEQTAWMRH